MDIRLYTIKCVPLCPVLYLYISFAYDLSCPDPSQVHLRRQHCHNVSKYACLEDLNKNNTFQESCNEEPYPVTKGRRYVFRGNSTFEICPANTYQPEPSVKGLYTMCILLKSICNELGQVLSSNTSEKEDSTCRCDYSSGYTYVSKPNDPYKCISSENDCTCYRKQCPSNGCLSPDYKCIEANTTQCTSIADTTLSSGSEGVPKTTVEIQTLQEALKIKSGNSAGILAIGIFGGIIACVGSLTVLVICLYHKKKEHLTRRTPINDNFSLKVAGNWKLLKASINLKRINPIMSKYSCGALTADGTNNKTENDQQNLVLYYLLEIDKSSVVQRNKILKEQSTLEHILEGPIEKPLWHKRCIEVCQRQLQNCVEVLKASLKPDSMVDDFLQSFVFNHDQLQNIIGLSTNLEKIEMFLKYLNDTLYRGSFECLLTQLRGQSLSEVLLDGLVRASFESGTIYSTSDLHLEDFRNIQVLISITTPITSSGWKYAAVKACSTWLIEELALYPESFQENNSEISLIPVADNIESRLRRGIENGALARFLENIFETDELLKSKIMETPEPKVNVSIRLLKAKEPRNVIKLSSEKQTGLQKIISLNKSFIMEDNDFNYLAVIKRLKKSGDMDFKNLIYPYGSFRNSNKKIFIEKLESKKDEKFLQIFFELLDAEHLCSEKVRKRLLICRKVYAAESRHLREKLIENFGSIVSVMINNETIYKDYKEICKKRKIYPDGFFKAVDPNCRERLLVDILMSEGRDGMLAIVETLYINDQDFLASDILYLDCGVLQESDLEKQYLICNDQDQGNGLFFKGQYKIFAKKTEIEVNNSNRQF